MSDNIMHMASVAKYEKTLIEIEASISTRGKEYMEVAFDMATEHIEAMLFIMKLEYNIRNNVTNRFEPKIFDHCDDITMRENLLSSHNLNNLWYSYTKIRSLYDTVRYYTGGEREYRLNSARQCIQEIKYECSRLIKQNKSVT